MVSVRITFWTSSGQESHTCPAHMMSVDSTSSTPPATVGRLTAYDVLTAGGVEEVEATLIMWAGQVWDSWSDDVQDVVRKLTVDLVPERYFRR